MNGWDPGHLHTAVCLIFQGVINRETHRFLALQTLSPPVFEKVRRCFSVIRCYTHAHTNTHTQTLCVQGIRRVFLMNEPKAGKRGFCRKDLFNNTSLKMFALGKWWMNVSQVNFSHQRISRLMWAQWFSSTLAAWLYRMAILFNPPLSSRPKDLIRYWLNIFTYQLQNQFLWCRNEVEVCYFTARIGMTFLYRCVYTIDCKSRWTMCHHCLLMYKNEAKILQIQVLPSSTFNY